MHGDYACDVRRFVGFRSSGFKLETNDCLSLFEYARSFRKHVEHMLVRHQNSIGHEKARADAFFGREVDATYGIQMRLNRCLKRGPVGERPGHSRIEVVE